jgi:hypothetical protein
MGCGSIVLIDLKISGSRMLFFNIFVSQVIVHAATHTSLEDRLSAHVLYFCLSDIAAEHCGGGVRQLLVRHIGQLAKDLNLMLRRRRGPAQGLHTLLRWGMKISKIGETYSAVVWIRIRWIRN